MKLWRENGISPQKQNTWISFTRIFLPLLSLLFSLPLDNSLDVTFLMVTGKSQKGDCIQIC